MSSGQDKHKFHVGILCGLTAAICYGFIPLLTIPLRGPNADAGRDAISDPSILFYRFGISAVVLALIMLGRRISFRVSFPEFVTLTYLAFLSDGAALFLLGGYDFMSSGVATTLHFTYPIMTALIMMMFFGETRKATTLLAVGMAVAGVGVLSWPSGGQSVLLRGVVIELLSALCFAFYLIRVNRSRVSNMNSIKLTFYVMALGAVIFAADAVRTDSFHVVNDAATALNLLIMAVVCTVVTNLALVNAVKLVGSTMTSVLGALEPLTAVVIGCLVLGEHFTLAIGVGIALVLPAVVILIKSREAD